MYATPSKELLPPFFFPMETMAVPPMMAATCRYSRRLYDAPPRRSDPNITGAILPDFASVARGKDNPLARARLMQALAVTCDAPEMANAFLGMPFVAPVSCIPAKPITTFAKASRTWRSHACLNCVPSAAVYRKTSSWREP